MDHQFWKIIRDQHHQLLDRHQRLCGLLTIKSEGVADIPSSSSQTIRKKRKTAKLMPKIVGPFQIVKTLCTTSRSDIPGRPAQRKKRKKQQTYNNTRQLNFSLSVWLLFIVWQRAPALSKTPRALSLAAWSTEGVPSKGAWRIGA